MNEQKHSPLPFSIHRTFPDTIMSGEVIIAEISRDMAISRQEQIANAAFIVTAANAHDDLVSALRRAESELAYAVQVQCVGSSWASQDGRTALAQARAALKKAGVA